MIQKVVFPSFRENEYSQYDMRQLVSALELRFQALESNVEGFFPSVEDETLDSRYALAVHTHVVADITDFPTVPSSIYDLVDVTGAASIGQGLIWTGSAYEPGSLGGTLALNDLTNVNAASPTDGQSLIYDVATLRWIPGTPVSTGATTLVDLTDTNLTGQVQGDLMFNATGSQWQATGSNFQWVDGQYILLGNDIGINWYDLSFTPVEMLTVVAGGTGIATDWGADINTDWSYNAIVATRANMVATGIHQSNTAFWQRFDVSPDGLHFIGCYTGTDEIVSFTLDSPFDFENGTQDGTAHSITNPWTCIQWADSGNKYFTYASSAQTFFMYATPSPYIINGTPAGATSSVSGANLGYPNAVNKSGWMSADGTYFATSSERSGSDDAIVMHTLSTPYDLSTYAFHSLQWLTGASAAPNAPAGYIDDIQISEDGLTIIVSQNSILWMGIFGTAFDVSTITWNTGGSRSVFGDTGLSSWWNAMHISGDGNSIYVYYTTQSVPSGYPVIAEYTKNASNPAYEAEYEALIVGDPGYSTKIDGTIVDVVANDFNVTSTNVDINGVDPTIHLGEVTGAQSLAVEPIAITNKDDVVADSTDDILIHDETDGALKKVNLSSVTDGGFF